LGVGGRSDGDTDNRYGRGHPARDSRDSRGRDAERVRPRSSSSTCKIAAFTWPARRDDDDEDGNDDYLHPGQGSQLGDSYWGLFTRERTRSPPRRRHADQNGRRHDSTMLQAQFTAALSTVPPPEAPSSIQADPVAGLSQLVRVCSLVDRLDGLSGQGGAAWSEGELVPVPRVFSRLRADLVLAPVPSVAEVERALDGLQVRLHQGAGGGGGGDKDSQNANTGNTGSAIALNLNDNAGANDDDAADSRGVDALFTAPTPVVLQPPATRRLRQRRAFDMSAVRRSARLAKKPAVPAVERAQRNLCRKLGLPAVESEPIETVLQDFIAMFRGPLPPHIVGALTAIFSLDDDDTGKLDDALLQHAGTAVVELSPPQEET
jgi:hypothetical protein